MMFHNILYLHVANVDKCKRIWSFADRIGSQKEYRNNFLNLFESIIRTGYHDLDHWFGSDEKVIIPYKESTGIPFIEVPSDVENFLNENGYIIVDYTKGKCVKKEQAGKIGKISIEQFPSIGRVLNNITSNKLKDITDPVQLSLEKSKYRKIINSYEQDSNRSGGKLKFGELVIVITRNTHDIAQMSYDKNWYSCMTCGNNDIKWRQLIQEVEDGGCVAYLIEKSKLPNLNQAIARLSIRKLIRNDEIYLVPESMVYGVSQDNANFIKLVKEWINKKTPVGKYYMHGALWSDKFKEQIYDEFHNRIDQPELGGFARYNSPRHISIPPENHEQFFNELAVKPILAYELYEWILTESEKNEFFHDKFGAIFNRSLDNFLEQKNINLKYVDDLKNILSIFNYKITDALGSNKQDKQRKLNSKLAYCIKLFVNKNDVSILSYITKYSLMQLQMDDIDLSSLLFKDLNSWLEDPNYTSYTLKNTKFNLESIKDFLSYFVNNLISSTPNPNIIKKLHETEKLFTISGYANEISKNYISSCLNHYFEVNHHSLESYNYVKRFYKFLRECNIIYELKKSKNQIGRNLVDRLNDLDFSSIALNTSDEVINNIYLTTKLLKEANDFFDNLMDEYKSLSREIAKPLYKKSKELINIINLISNNMVLKIDKLENCYYILSLIANHMKPFSFGG